MAFIYSFSEFGINHEIQMCWNTEGVERERERRTKSGVEARESMIDVLPPHCFP
jgi:hypothetical protein